ncbi:MAG: heavy metal translocating P-type ATPase [Anaerolineaceae bacterium]
MEKTIELEVRSLLPGIESDQDACIHRLEKAMQNRREMQKAHLEVKENHVTTLCLHYDSERNSVEEVTRMAEQAGFEILNRYKHESIPILGMDCSDCAAVIDHSVGRLPGVVSASVNYPARKLRVEYDSYALSRRGIVKRIRSMGYEVPLHPKHRWLIKNRALLMSLFSGVLLLIGWAGETFLGLPAAASLVLFLGTYAIGGWEITGHAFHALRERRFDTDLLMIVAALGAAALGEFTEGALLIFLFSLGHALEERALDKARRAIESLADLAPRTALVRRAEGEVELPVENINLNDLVIARPGVRIPVDGLVMAGTSGVDQSPITGESIPVDKAAGDKVFAGTVNGEGTLEISASRLADDSTLARVIQMVDDAQARKSPTHQSIERLERIFVPGVLIATTLVIVLPPLIGAPFRESFLRAMTLLVAASPCALALGAPAAVLTGVARAARMGVLVKGGAHLENLGQIKAVAFDKTGTITHGKPEVTDVVSFQSESIPANRVLALAAALENQSGHPLAAAVVRAARKDNLALPVVGPLTSLTGRGLRSSFESRELLLGSLTMLEGAGIMPSAGVKEQAAAMEEQGKTTILLAFGEGVIGLIALADTLRPEAAEAMKELRELGIEYTAMLSGDNAPVASAIARQAGLSEYYANQMPQDKAAAIQEMITKFGPVAMVGDGVNDAPALANATVGIAMGGAATDVALETADVALMGSDLRRLPFAIGLGRATHRVILQNLTLALGVIAVLAVSSLAGWSGMGVAVFFHEGSTILVVLNALRLLNYKL